MLAKTILYKTIKQLKQLKHTTQQQNMIAICDSYVHKTKDIMDNIDFLVDEYTLPDDILSELDDMINQITHVSLRVKQFRTKVLNGNSREIAQYYNIAEYEMNRLQTQWETINNKLQQLEI